MCFSSFYVPSWKLMHNLLHLQLAQKSSTPTRMKDEIRLSPGGGII